MQRWTPEIDARIWELRSSGHSNAETAEIVGRDKTHIAWRVNQIRHRMGLVEPYGEDRPERPRSADPTPEEIAAAIARIGFPARRPPWIDGLKAEVIRCRRIAVRNGWRPRPTKKRNRHAA